MDKNEGLKTQTPENTAMEVPSWIPKGDTTGTAMAAEDLRLPRLAIAQGLSPELTPGNVKYIEGLSMFDMFNDLTQEIYGKKTLTFVPLRHDVRRIQFKPRSEGGGVIDMNVPPNDPRTQWTSDPTDPKKRFPPLATKFHEYVIMLVREDGLEPVVLSIKDTNKQNRLATTNLNGYIAMPTKIGARRVQLPIYGKMYTVESGNATNDKGTYGVPVIKQAGILNDADMGMKCLKFAQSLEGKNIVVEREPGDETDFDTAAMDATPASPSDM